MAVLYGNSTGSGYWRVNVYYDLYVYDTYVAAVINVYRYALKADTSGYDATTDTTSITFNGSASGKPTWNHSNSKGQERKLWGGTLTLSRTTYAYNVTLGGANTHPGSHTMSGTSSAYTTYTVPALASYTVAYNANGGQGAPANQAKFYTVNLQLSSTQPTRTGYTFNGWNTAANGTGTSYSPGGWYTANAAVTLYAQWTPRTYDVYYDANGGTGTMSAQEFTYDTSDNLNTNSFTRNDYLFIGWALSANGAKVFNDGAEVLNLATGTETENYTLYAVWKYQFTAPDLQTPNARRATNGQPEDSGTGGLVSVYVTPAIQENSDGSVQYINTIVTAEYSTLSGNSVRIGNPIEISTPQTVPSSNNWIVSDGVFNTDYEYAIRFTAKGTVGANKTEKCSTIINTMIPTANFAIDLNPNNNITNSSGSIGLFAIAPNEDKIVLVGKDGDICFELRDDTASGIDSELLSAFAARRWTYHEKI